ncbi:MAG TPA: porin [Usitatibacter sp.]|jgi:predicted porin|nr:porin [Usitatibacter sp.]
MNKKLIALAVFGACVAPAAMAQTAGPVTLYGRVYETVVSVEGKAGGTAAAIDRRTRIDDQASLLGVRGTEDLGGGLQAFFQLETAFKPDQNDTTFAARNSGVGLQGGWGSVIIGRWDTPYKVSTYPVDAFGDLTMAGISGLGHDQGNFDRRDQNMIQYWSPNFAGFAFKGMYQVNEAKTATTNPHDTSANVTYTRGPVYAFLAYEDHKDPSATVKKEKAWSAGGAFTFGPIKLGAEYEKINRNVVTGPDPTDRKEWLASVVYTLANNQFIYQHQDSKDVDCKSDTLAYKYNFSKRTFFIAEYMKTDNKDSGTCSFATTATFPVAKGQDVRAAAVGLQHVF